MCLIIVGWQVCPEYPLIVAANRDEFYARPTAVVACWADTPSVVAGRDLEAGGTWLGVADRGRFAAVTNVREPGSPAGRLSRGCLTRDFLTGTMPAGAFVEDLSGEAYSGFNLLVADESSLWYRSNRNGAARELMPGTYGVSNHLLDTPWPKLTSAKRSFSQAIERSLDESRLFALLADDEIVPDDALPATGVPLAWERLLSAIFVRSPDYGTRASTVVVRRRDGSGFLYERSFDAQGMIDDRRIAFGDA